MVFSWFSTKEVKQFANELAEEFSKRYPLSEVQQPSSKSESRLRGAKDLMMSRTQVFAERNKLNLYKRANLANTLKWKFHEMGYASEVSDPLVMEVTRIVTLIRPQR
ncbi:hypothetical protein [Uliginosibacterium sediminicola]|uniref:Uncharacterized protein n=1 Tax=Uliginosibacterium sediminicola TaxID=2024550 RepID=A0ABU9Z421_9RHOO